MRLKRTPLRARAIFAVQIDSAWLQPVTASFEMTLQDGMRRPLPSSVTVRPAGSVSSEIVGMLDPGERPVALVTRVSGDGIDLEVISNLDHGTTPAMWPIAIAGVAIPATSAIVAWYFATQAARNATPPPRLPSLPRPDGFAASLALPALPAEFIPPAAPAMLPAVVTSPHELAPQRDGSSRELAPQRDGSSHDLPATSSEPIRVGHDRVGQKRLRRIVEPAPPAAWAVGPLSSQVVGKAAVRTLGLAVTAAITAISAIAAIAFVHPQVAELAMPAPIPRGSHVDVLYRLAGFGNGEYTLVDADGTPLDSGSLAAKQGTLRIDIPSHVTGRPVTLHVVMTGPFGDARRDLSADVLATPAPPSAARVAPRIEMLSLDNNSVSGGDLLTVRYRVTPPVGAVMITDATGAVLASSALTSAGKSFLRIPPSDRNRDVAVIVRATGSGGGIETRIPLRIAPGPRTNAPPPVAPAITATTSTIPGDDGNEIAVLTPRVSSGQAIRLHVPLPYDHLTISLLDSQRRTVTEREYAAAYDPVRIEAPAVRLPTTFELHVSVTHGSEVNIGVYRVVVTPATAASTAATP